MAPGIKNENFFHVWRSIAQNSVKLWRNLLYEFRDTKIVIRFTKYRASVIKNTKLWGLKHGTWE